MAERSFWRCMANLSFMAAGCLVLGAVLARGQEKSAPPVEQERKVAENEVPKAALESLKRISAGAAITEFAEEIERGQKFYEGSWKGPNGSIDALVTEAGDLVELEEVIAVDKVPAAPRAEVEKEAGKDAKITWEKKTYILYEAHYKKDGRGREVLLSPDGRRHQEEVEKEEGGEEDEK